MTNEIAELSADIHVITAEINAYQRVAGEAIFEIGRRLKHVKENDLAHGDFIDWCEHSANIPYRQANRFMRVSAEMGDTKMTTSSHLGLNALYEIATMPESERTQPQTIPSTGETKTVDEMTVRELREVKKALKEAQQQAEVARKDAEIKERQLERTQSELERATTPKVEVVEREVERIVEVDKTDYNAVDRLRKYEEKFGALENYSDRVRATNVDDVTTSVISFSKAVRDLAKRHAYLIKYRETIEVLDVVTRREYNEAVQALHELAGDFYKTTGSNGIVDAVFAEVQ